MNVKDMFSLKDKVILVTGGKGKYGKYITEALAEADGTVITASRSLDDGQKLAKEFQTRGLNVSALQLDQGDHDSIIKLRSQIEDQFGRLNVLVNCAGITIWGDTLTVLLSNGRAQFKEFLR